MCLEVFEGFFGKLLFRNNYYLLRLKISLARSDELDEKSTWPTSDLTRKYKQARPDYHPDPERKKFTYKEIKQPHGRFLSANHYSTQLMCILTSSDYSFLYYLHL